MWMWMSVAFAKPATVTVEVLSVSDVPIPQAVVVHPEERERHRVNTQTGRWSETILYMKDGREVPFEKGMEVKFEVSAPGYRNESVVSLIKKKKHLITVRLEQMDL